MELPLTITIIEKYTVVELRTPSLMDPILLSELGQKLYSLVDKEDRRQLILDFEKVEYISSQTIGIIISLHKKIAALPHGIMIMCGVGPRLMELMKITRLDRKITIKPDQEHAVKVKIP
jgi:anti-anti-sigma factor